MNTKNNVDIKYEGDSGHMYVNPYIKGEKLPFCNSIITDNEQNPTKITFVKGEYPCLSIENIETDLSQFIKIASIILQNELMKHGDLYNGFLASIESSLNEQQQTFLYRNPKWIAEEILKRIIGDE